MLDNLNTFDLSYKQTIVGVDEAGRGCWAGPVVVCAAKINNYDSNVVKLLNDSKLLSDKKRRIIYEQVINSLDFTYKIIEIKPQIIDQINILEATKLGMQKATRAICETNDLIIADAVKFETPNNIESLIKADMKSAAVALASIMAKVHRDNLMIKLAKKYPAYGFESHKSYGTKQHQEALKTHGPIKNIHRFSYKPIKNLIGENNF